MSLCGASALSSTRTHMCFSRAGRTGYVVIRRRAVPQTSVDWRSSELPLRPLELRDGLCACACAPLHPCFTACACMSACVRAWVCVGVFACVRACADICSCVCVGNSSSKGPSGGVPQNLSSHWPPSVPDCPPPTLPTSLPPPQTHTQRTHASPHVHSLGVIEDSADALQADFANKYLGGGVLCGGCVRTGRSHAPVSAKGGAHTHPPPPPAPPPPPQAHVCMHGRPPCAPPPSRTHTLTLTHPCSPSTQVQEEIRFAKSPECAAACAFCPVMQSNEAITVTGTEVFSGVTGYMFALRFAGWVCGCPRLRAPTLACALL
jgi:hypothetical protein